MLLGWLAVLLLAAPTCSHHHSPTIPTITPPPHHHLPAPTRLGFSFLQVQAMRVVKAQMFIADRFIGWQEATLKALQTQYQAATKVGDLSSI